MYIVTLPCKDDIDTYRKLLFTSFPNEVIYTCISTKVLLTKTKYYIRQPCQLTSKRSFVVLNKYLTRRAINCKHIYVCLPILTLENIFNTNAGYICNVMIWCLRNISPIFKTKHWQQLARSSPPSLQRNFLSFKQTTNTILRS